MQNVGGWVVETVVGDAQVLHDSVTPTVRTVRVMRPTRAAIVLGSSQPESDVDHDFCRDHDLDVVRRRSGGGAVFVHPTETVWVDFIIPRGDSLWHDDVATAMVWVGDVWLAALERAGMTGLSIHTDRFVRNDWSAALCFAGIGTGEVLSGERKAVGISQRRTRDSARFQCSGHLVWRPDIVSGAVQTVRSDADRLDGLVACLPSNFDGTDVVAVLPP